MPERHPHGANGTQAMDNAAEDAILEQAIAWQQALARDDADWTGFTEWLESNPRNRVVFDEVTFFDDMIERNREAVRTILPREETARRGGRRWLIGTGIAAALVAAVGLPLLLQTPQASPVVYASRPGETRTVALADGSRIALSADSAVEVADHHITLDRGDAYFNIPHDPARRLTITAGGYRIEDIGTRFAIDTGADRVAVAVAEGRLTVTPPTGDKVTLTADQRLAGGRDAPPRITTTIPDAVGSWRKGRLVYDDAPLTMVADDVSRYRGSPVILDPALADRRFSGVLVIGDGSQLVSDLAGLAGLHMERRGDTVVLGAGTA